MTDPKECECGRKPEIYIEYSPERYRVECYCGIKTAVYQTELRAVGDWNIGVRYAPES